MDDRNIVVPGFAVKLTYREYLETKSWTRRRDAAFARDHGECRRCGSPAEHVHHLTYERVGWESPDDLVSLCGTCHEKAHGLRCEIPAEEVPPAWRRAEEEILAASLVDEAVLERVKREYPARAWRCRDLAERLPDSSRFADAE